MRIVRDVRIDALHPARARGSYAGTHTVNMTHNEKQNGKGNNGKAYAGSNTHSNSFQHVRPNSANSEQTHYTVKPADGPAETCTINSTSGPTGGCFHSNNTYSWTLLEDPLTHDGTIVLTTTSIVSSCSETSTVLSAAQARQ